ncbi:MAG: hypothetical protein VKL42_22960 [Snowella sp.]|nr:hypothetical protein [Snowella sp.]
MVLQKRTMTRSWSIPYYTLVSSFWRCLLYAMEEIEISEAEADTSQLSPSSEPR